MNLQLRRHVFSVLLILVSLGSLAYVVAAGLNYTRFYPALSELDPRVDWISVERESGSGNVLLSANVVVANPADYSGLRLYGFVFRLVFVHRYLSNVSLFEDQPLLASQTLGRPLGPRSAIESGLAILLPPELSAAFLRFNQTYPGQVSARTSLRVQINTFLDPVIGRLSIDKAEDFPI